MSLVFYNQLAAARTF